ncbi:hypothetical protein NDU88_003195 [Pleurodeles waltl]|uniref:Uncharacterized protein n=1 Tax=Pleurodeles waltl TaxID=8319 RepID=A0AAV7TP07_PLEWA|nr:hypothetical protein NDU88_003195 [Pleurodeles waltl]
MHLVTGSRLAQFRYTGVRSSSFAISPRECGGSPAVVGWPHLGPRGHLALRSTNRYGVGSTGCGLPPRWMPQALSGPAGLKAVPAVDPQAHGSGVSVLWARSGLLRSAAAFCSVRLNTQRSSSPPLVGILMLPDPGAAGDYNDHTVGPQEPFSAWVAPGREYSCNHHLYKEMTGFRPRKSSGLNAQTSSMLMSPHHRSSKMPFLPVQRLGPVLNEHSRVSCGCKGL